MKSTTSRFRLVRGAEGGERGTEGSGGRERVREGQRGRNKDTKRGREGGREGEGERFVLFETLLLKFIY